jgi:hypothetical protein
MQYHKRLIFLSIIFIFLSGLLVGCSDPNDEYIQGIWAAGDVHYWAEWVFENGYYAYTSMISIHGTTQQRYGYYRIIKSEGDQLILELTNDSSSDPFDETAEIAITIDREADKLKIGRNEYNRVIARSLEETKP